MGFAVLDGVSNFLTPVATTPAMSIFGKLKYGAACAIDSISYGFGIGTTFGVVGVELLDGKQVAVATRTSSPNGGWQKTGAIGLTLIITDAVQSKLLNWALGRRQGARLGGVQLTSS